MGKALRAFRLGRDTLKEACQVRGWVGAPSAALQAHFVPEGDEIGLARVFCNRVTVDALALQVSCGVRPREIFGDFSI